MAVCNALNRDLNKICHWCDTWGMRLNPKKCSSFIVSRSRTLNPPNPSLFVNGQLLSDTSSLKLLGVVFDQKLTFETHIRSTVSNISQKVGILRKCRSIYDSNPIVRQCFYSFILPFFEYCAPVWSSAADCHLRLFDRVFNMIRFLLPDININLEHRRSVGSMSLFYKIFRNPSHPLHSKLPQLFNPVRVTRRTVNLNNFSFNRVICSTEQFSRSFFPSCVEIWNSLDNDVVQSNDVQTFKLRFNRHILSRNT